mgnify:CR=1 FL=1
MYQAVLGGQCVACFEDTPIMKASIKDGGLALKVLDDTASDPAPYGFAIFSADSQELLDMFNAAWPISRPTASMTRSWPSIC